MHEADTKVINKNSMVAMRDEYEKIAVSIPAIARTGRAARQGWRKAKGLFQKAKDYTKGLTSGLKGNKKHPLDRKLVNRNFLEDNERFRRTVTGSNDRNIAAINRWTSTSSERKRWAAARTRARKAIPKATVRGNVVGQAVRRSAKKVAPPYAGFWAGVGTTKAMTSPKPKTSPAKASKAPKAPVVPNRADFINRQ